MGLQNYNTLSLRCRRELSIHVFNFLLPGSTWILESRFASQLDWMLIGIKTWLQFLFLFYIWAIVGVIIVACCYSSQLTKHIGSKAVSLLATLFLHSQVTGMKLLRTVIDATSVAVITQYPTKQNTNTSYAVWHLTLLPAPPR